MIELVDGNNFFVSCERVFNSRLVRCLTRHSDAAFTEGLRKRCGETM